MQIPADLFDPFRPMCSTDSRHVVQPFRHISSTAPGG